MHGQTKNIVFIVIILVVVFFAIGHNSVMKWAVREVAKSFVGIELEMDSVHLGIMKTDIKLSNAVVMSPKGFENEQTMKASDIYMNYELIPLLFKKVHLTDLKLNISEIVVIKNPKGKMNTDAVKKMSKNGIAQEGGKGSRGLNGLDKKESIPLKIDYATISIGKVVFKDYSLGGRPQVSTIKLGFSKAQFRDIRWDDVLAGMRFLSSVSESAPRPLLKGLESILGSHDVIEKSLKELGKKLK